MENYVSMKRDMEFLRGRHQQLSCKWLALLPLIAATTFGDMKPSEKSALYRINHRSREKSTHWHVIQVRDGTQKLDYLVSILAIQFIYLPILLSIWRSMYVIFVRESYIIPRTEDKPKRETMRSKNIILLGHGISFVVVVSFALK